ncbi:MAG: DUF3575 domain-containing protein [Bacteroidetes bacterium]|nr:MAG: DUF3575 domain-containing protein [Bacteroidota bacterium]
MKKSLLVLACTLGVLQAFSQSSEKMNNIKVNILSPLVRTGSVFYERKLGAATSAQLGVFYTGFESDGVQLRGFGITPEFRFYPGAKGSMEGFYLAPFARYQNFNISDAVSKGTLSTIGGGLLIGGQWIFGRGVSLDTFLGPSFNVGDVKVTSGTAIEEPGSASGFGLRAGLSVGFAF